MSRSAVFVDCRGRADKPYDDQPEGGRRTLVEKLDHSYGMISEVVFPTLTPSIRIKELGPSPFIRRMSISLCNPAPGDAEANSVVPFEVGRTPSYGDGDLLAVIDAGTGIEVVRLPKPALEMEAEAAGRNGDSYDLRPSFSAALK